MHRMLYPHKDKRAYHSALEPTSLDVVRLLYGGKRKDIFPKGFLKVGEYLLTMGGPGPHHRAAVQEEYSVDIFDSPLSLSGETLIAKRKQNQNKANQKYEHKIKHKYYRK